jgi:hypothetical protein
MRNWPHLRILGTKNRMRSAVHKIGHAQIRFGCARPFPKNALQNVFVREFPNVWRFIRAVNGKRTTTLFRILQRIESTIFVVLVGEILMTMGIPAMTLHDSVVCRKCDVSTVQDAIRQALGEYRMKLNDPEDWG